MRGVIGTGAWFAGGLAAAACGGVSVVERGEGGGGGSTGSGVVEELPEPVAEACPELADEALVCLSWHWSDLWAVSPTTGKTCSAVHLPGLTSGPHFGSLAVVGGDAYRCARGEVLRISLSSGEVEESYEGCSSVTASGGKLVVRPLYMLGDGWTSVEVFGSVEALREGAPEARLEFPSFPEGFRDSFQIHATRDRLYVTKNSRGDRVQVFDFPAMTRLPDLVLQGFTREVAGLWIDVEAETAVVLSWSNDDPESYAQISTFDLTDGVLLSEVTLDEPFMSFWEGLTCWYNGQALQ